MIDNQVNHQDPKKHMALSLKQQQQITEERRAQILSAAVRIFAIRGFADTKISDIASAADLSYGLVYHYFKTKDDIFTELITQAHNQFIAALEQISEFEGGPLDKIRTFTEIASPRGSNEENTYYTNIILQAHISARLPETVKSIIDNSISKHNEIIGSLIAEGQKLGQIVQGDPKKLAFTHYSMLCGMIVMQIIATDFTNHPISVMDPDTVIRALKDPLYNDFQSNGV
jgi:AcrR family transcriptional regulator